MASKKKKKIRFRISKFLIFFVDSFLSDKKCFSILGIDRFKSKPKLVKDQFYHPNRTYFKILEMGNSELVLGSMNKFNKKMYNFLGGMKTPVSNIG